MCAIVDASVLRDVFGPDRPEAGKKFYSWITQGSGRLVIGGKVTQEFYKMDAAKIWAEEAMRAGKLKIEDDTQMANKTKALKTTNDCKSNDLHVIALAQISGARLLYAKDKDLENDFKRMLRKPNGKIYKTPKNGEFNKSHKKMLSNKSLCRN